MNIVEASCQSQNVGLNTQLFTTQLGFTYGLSNVWSYASDGSTIIHPSLTYLNNTLENCSVNNIFIDLVNTNTFGNNAGWSWQTSTTSAVATCSAYNGESRSFFNMTAQYQIASSIDSGHSNGITNGVALGNIGFLNLDQKSKACLWWGHELLVMWFWNMIDTLATYADNNVTDANTITNARLSMAPSGHTNITSLDFFNITGWFYMGNGDLHALQVNGKATSHKIHPILAGVDVGLQVHHFATVFYSTILSDLGQPNGPNILTDFGLIQQYVLEGYDVRALPGFNAANTTAQQAFDQAKARAGPLSISPSTFNSQYICQVPRRRKAGPVLIAVLVADIVFLQALFNILTLTTTWFLARTDKQSNYCEGCKKQVAGQNQEEAWGFALLSLSPEHGKSVMDEGRRKTY